MRLPWWLSGRESACQCRRRMFDPWARKTSWRRKWQPALVFLPGEFHGQRSLVGCSPRGCKELDMTEHAHRQEMLAYILDNSASKVLFPLNLLLVMVTCSPPYVPSLTSHPSPLSELEEMPLVFGFCSVIEVK